MTYNGRINRATYWVWFALVAALYVVLSVVLPGRTTVSEVVLIIVCVPRLHDIGRSGWLVLGPLALEIAVVVAGMALLPAANLLMVGGVATLVILAAMIWLGAIPGEPTANRFGEPPAPSIQLRRKPKKADPGIASTFD